MRCLPTYGPLEAWRDSCGTVLLLWTPDNRIGNSSLEVYRRSRNGDSTRVAALDPNRSAFWTSASAESGETWAVRARNPYGAAPLSGWAGANDAGVDTFACQGVCLADSTVVLPGFARLDAATTCDQAALRNDSLAVTIVYLITERGVLERIEPDSGSATETVVIWCP